MKKTKFLSNIFLSGIFLTGIFSCEVKDGNVPPINGNSDSSSDKVSEYLESRIAPTQSFSMSSTESNTITTSGGSTITIPANAFEDMNGNPVSGDVIFKVVEIFDKSDMVKSDRPTTSNGSLLESGGEYALGATTTGGDSLQLADGVNVDVSTPVTDNFNDFTVPLFIGETDENGEFNWEELVDSARNVNQASYFFNIDTLAWINVDKFVNGSPTTLTVNLGDGANTSKSLTYVVFNDLNSVMKLYNALDEDTYEQAGIPIGEDVTILSLAEIDNKLQKASKDVTVTADMTVDLEFDELTEAELDAFLDALDD